MLHPSAKRRPWIGVFALAMALVVMLRFAAVELHYALEHDHAPDEHCEVCLVFERAGDGGALAGTGPVAPRFAQQRLPAADATLTAPFAPCPPARGPPGASA